MDNPKDTMIEDILEQLIQYGPDDMANIFAQMFNMAMRFEREGFIGASRYERTPDRRAYANGYKPKLIDTPADTVTIQVPRAAGHDGEPFFIDPTPAPSRSTRGIRSSRAVMPIMAEMYFKGVSTRDERGVLRKLGIENMSTAQMSRAAKMLRR